MARFFPWRKSQDQRLDSDSDQSPGPSSSFPSTVSKPEQLQKENQYPYDPYHISKEDISKVTVSGDQRRRRIRGYLSVRNPFFTQMKLAPYLPPKDLYQIVSDRDERRLKLRVPEMFGNRTFGNYKKMFKAWLWIDEIENELRLRQHDMRNVSLTKFGSGTETQYTFQVPGIQDFQPPLSVHNTFDTFDANTPFDAMYQGTITRIDGTQVTCSIGEAFNQHYSGLPVTIQFDLQRTNYQRCHFAVVTAVNHLGKDFLFPNETITPRSARIHVVDDEETDNDEEKIKAKPNYSSTVFRSSKSTVAHKSIFSNRPLYSPTTSSSDVTIGRRTQSAREFFVSKTASEPSCSEAKLRWFNKSLDERQKEAVRRILRGEARPLPYVICGASGTGKTATLVEAVIQLNKVDTNSRILVCAPSDAATDRIAEQLVSCGKYRPGDFIRINGFTRARESVPAAIRPYCAVGENSYISNVAKERLILTTCFTAGQFYSLNLTSGHFTHVFIDEANSCSEPDTMVPAILLAVDKGGQLILAGDHHKPLGPAFMSSVAWDCELGKSFLERLMYRKLYSRDAEKFPVEDYNPLVVTRLVKNY